MFRENPHATIRDYKFHLREHLICATLLTIGLIVMVALLAIVLSNPFASRFEMVSAVVNWSARTFLSLFVAASAVRLIADLWMALFFTREIQHHEWAALSLHQQTSIP